MSQGGEIDEIRLTSVGVDVGSSTSHLIFSELLLRRDEKSASRRFYVDERRILYESEIIDTPLIDPTTINVNELIEFFQGEYQKAGFNPEEINTGAVIVTGETAKKQNAAEIVSRLSNDAGKFVSATAGPNFESMLAAMGSGMTARSEETGKSVLSVDIGGGTSNMAISRGGEVVSTACISVGGRLLAVEDSKIWRIDVPARKVMKHLGMTYEVGDTIPEEDVKKIADTFAEVLREVISGPTTTELAKELMMTSDLDFGIQVDEIAFSGGVAELIYNHGSKYRDIGHYLADSINQLRGKYIAPVVEPENKIRATVIGAGAYSLTISGSTSFSDDHIPFPLRNIPVIKVDVDRERLSMEHVEQEIRKSFERFDITEGTESVALYFKDPVRAAYKRLKLFAQALASALPKSIANDIPIVLVFERDIGNSVGNVIRRESEIKKNLLAIDELILSEGDWIDIGDPLVNGQVFPVTVKSLVFNKD
ncbi:MAG: ethanolamine ammonia-lyase reactivating factor EutA [Candidatus Kariarchaeaceae archaeon]|jgi:ethanolamine utilization protein EutA